MSENGEAAGEKKPVVAPGNAGKPKKRRRLWRLLLIVLVLLAALVALAPMLLSGFARGKVIEQLQARLDAKVGLEDVSLGWLSGAHVQGVSITASGASEESLSLGNLKVEPDISDYVLSSRIRARVLIEDLTIRVRRKDGRIDLLDMVKPTQEEEAPAEKLPDLDVSVEVRNLIVSFSDPDLGDRPSVLHLSRVDISLVSGKPLSWSLAHPAGISASGELDLIADGYVLPSEKISAQALVTGTAVDLEELGRQLAPWMEEVSGKLDLSQKVNYRGDDIQTQGKLSVKGLRLGLPGGTMSGDLAAGVNFNQQGGDWKPGLIKLDFLDGNLKPAAEGVAPVKLGAFNLRCALDPGRTMRCGTFKLTGGALEVNGTATCTLAEQGPTGNANLTLEGDLAPLQGFLSGVSRLAGRMRSSLRWQGLDAGGMALSGGTEIDDLEIVGSGPGETPLQEKKIVLRHDFEWRSGLLDFKNVRVASRTVAARMTGQLDIDTEKQTATGAIELVDGRVDLDRLAGAVPFELPVAGKGVINFSGSARGQADTILISAHADSPGLSLAHGAFAGGPLEMGSLTLDASGPYSVKERRLDLKSIRLISKPLTADASVVVLLPESGSPGIQAKGNVGVDLDALWASLGEDAESMGLGRGTARFQVGLEGDQVDANSLVVQAAGFTLKSNGKVSIARPGTPEGELVFGLRGNLEQLPEKLRSALSPDISGVTTVMGKVRLGEEITVQKLDLASDMLKLGLAKPVVISGIGGGGGLVARGSLQGRVDLERIPSGLLALREGASVRGSATLSCAGGFDQHPIIESLSLQAPGTEIGFKDGSSMSSNLSLSANLDPKGAWAVNLSGKEVAFRSRKNPAGDVTGDTTTLQASGYRDAEGAYQVSRLVINGSGLDVSGSTSQEKGRRDRFSAEANLNADVFTKTWLRIFAPEISILGKGGAKLDLAMAGPGTDQGGIPSGTVKLNLDGLDMPGLEVRELLVEAEASEGSAVIKTGKAKINDGTATFGGSYDLGSDDPSWDVALQTVGVSIREKLQPAIARAIPLFAGIGVTVTADVDADLKLKGQGVDMKRLGETAEGGGRLKVSAGKIKGGPILGTISSLVGSKADLDFEPFDVAFQVKDGRIHQEGFVISSSVMDLRLTGSSSIAGDLDYIVGVKLKGQSSQKWQRLASLLGPDGFLPLPLKGNISSPALQPPDLKSLIANPVEGLLKKGLGDLLNKKKKKDQ